MKEIPLTRGLFALVDDADFARVNQFKWQAKPCAYTFYATRTMREGDGNRREVSMHRFILGTPQDKDVDHINGDGLDNRRENMRECRTVDNCRNRRISRNNSTGFKGVTLHKPGRWRAIVTPLRKPISLGLFGTPEAAARAYDTAAIRVFGEFAKTNVNLGLLPPY